MRDSTAKSNSLACPLCGTLSTRIATKEERAGKPMLNMRKYRKCDVCGCVFEPPLGKWASLFLIATASLGLYVCLREALESLFGTDEERSVVGAVLGIGGAIGGLYLAALAFRSLLRTDGAHSGSD